MLVNARLAWYMYKLLLLLLLLLRLRLWLQLLTLLPDSISCKTLLWFCERLIFGPAVTQSTGSSRAC